MVPPEAGRGRVACLACGEEVERREARAYDKDGDQWERRGKRLEYLCQPCHDDLGRANRTGLEETLVEIDAGACDRGTFLRRYLQAVDGQHGPTGEQ